MDRTTITTVPADVRGRTRVGNKHDVPSDGFIRLAPKTHDISLIGEHIPDIAHLAADLQVAVSAAWSRRHDIRYSKVHVLLLRWEDDDLGVATELKDLQHVFMDLFQYGVTTYEIPTEKPDKALKRRVFDFLDHDGDETLLILYYAGHAKTSVQVNEAPVWFANRSAKSPSLPSGGIQSMFEEADADVLLLYDCCHSAAITASNSSPGHKGVTEVIAACGYEAIAPEVGENSFSNALAEVLAAASKAKPFSVAELHTRVLNRLKCWTPSFVKDENGKRKEDPIGRLQYERQPRRTPIYSILCETEPRRSILLAPLQPPAADSVDLASGSSSSPNRSASYSIVPTLYEGRLGFNDRERKRKRAVDEVIEYPQVLLAIRLDKHELDLDAWKECLLRQLPPDAKEIKIEGIFGSFSTLLLLRMPVAVWDVLPENPAYSFVGFVTTENQAVVEPAAVELTDTVDTPLPSDLTSKPITFESPRNKEEIPTKPLDETDEILRHRESLRRALAQRKEDHEESGFSEADQAPASHTNTPWGSIPMRALSREATPISPPASVYQTSEGAPDSPRSMASELAYTSVEVAEEEKNEPHSRAQSRMSNFHSLPTPSVSAYSVSSHGMNPPPPSSHYQPSIADSLPRSTAGYPSGSISILQSHAAALQHEVSVQKIALSSLQGEHDKLLAAFSRSQSRNNKLEQKFAASDSEIVSLTEEKLRLQTQVIELENDTEELAHSRDELRQAAVHEGSQYLEIVKKASRLEEIAGEERKAWKRTLSQYVGTDADLEDVQTEDIDQNEPGSTVRRQRRKVSGGSTVGIDDSRHIEESRPKDD